MSVRTANGYIYGLLFLSGCCGLGYEMVWVRALSAGLGHEIVSVLSVMAAFFVGTAAGAWLLDRPIRTSTVPHRWYAALEMTIALWAAALSFLIPGVASLGAALMGVHPSSYLQWSVTFLLPLLLLLPATMAMGATLPAMDAITSRLHRRSYLVGGLYAANTLGAVAGSFAVTFWIVPAAGFSGTQKMLAAVNVVCAAGAYFWRGNPARPERPAPEAVPGSQSGRLLLTLFLTGLLGIGYEVVTVRTLNQVLENTVFSYAVLLSVYLLGTSGGACFYQKRLRGRPFAPTLSGLLAAQALACTAGMWALGLSMDIYDRLKPMGVRPAEAGLAVTVFLVPTFVMGSLFSHLAQSARNRNKRFGAALAVNTMGGALAPFLFGILALPCWGPAGAMFAICTGYLLLLPGLRRTTIRTSAACAAAAALILAVSGSFDFRHLAPGEEVAAHQYGIMADVAVVRDSHRDFHLKVNNHYQMGGTASRYSDRRQAYIPLMLHPDPEKVLFLGLGTGTTFSAAAKLDRLQVDGVELIPEVVRMMPYFQEPEQLEAMSRQNENRHIFIADARRFVLASRRQYDVIIADLFHPSRDGAGFLYTSEHFKAVRRRLSQNGIFCQWLPLYQMDLDLLRLIVRTFLTVFPDATAFIAHHSLNQPIVGLIGGRRPLRVSVQDFSRSMTAHPDRAEALGSVGLTSIYTVLGCYLADARQLKEFAGPGPVNTDDRPVVMFQAPGFVYAQAGNSPASHRIMALVQECSPNAGDILSPQAEDAVSSRLAAYWQARDAYLRLGARVAAGPGPDPETMVARVAGPLLDIVRMSPDFEAAYHPLLVMAARLHHQNPQMADNLLTALEAAAPQRSDAARIRLQLSRGS